MALEQYQNNADTTLNGAINNSVTSVVVTTGSVFPATGNFRVLVDTELMIVTARSTNTLTVTRGAEGTTAASHADLAAITHVLTAASLLQMEADGFTADTLANLPSAGRAGRIYLPTDQQGALFRDNGSSWDKYYPGRAGDYPPFTPTGIDDEFDDNSFSGWTLVDDGTHQATVTELNDTCSILFPGGDTGAHFHAWLKSATVSTGDIIEANLRFSIMQQNFNQFGICMANGTTYGTSNMVVWVMSTNENGMILNLIPGFNSNGGGSLISLAGGNIPAGLELFLRLKYNGSNSWSGYISPDGISWQLLLTASKTLTPSYVGFCGTTWGGSQPMVVSMKYIRKTT